MTHCGHTPKYPDLAHVPSAQECESHLTFVEGVPEVTVQRALTSKDGETTRVDRPYWDSLTQVQRMVLIAHERAHPCIGMQVSCEGCADKVAGYFLQAWGYCPDVVRSTVRSMRIKREPGHGQAADNAYVGAKQAERGLAGRGLMGASPSTVNAKLAAERGLLPVTQLKVTTTAALPITTKSTATTTPTGATSTATGTAGTGSTPLDPLPAQPLAASQTQAQGSSPGAPAAGTSTGFVTTPTGVGVVDGLNAGIAGDVVSSVLGEDARSHTGKVLIGAGVAAIVAVVLVVIVRRR